MATPASSTVLKAFDVLNLFADHALLGAGDVAGLLGVPRASAHRMLVTLATAGVAESNGSGQYRLGYKLFELGQVVPGRMRLCQSASVPLQQLAAELRLPAHLGVREAHDVLYLEKAQHQDTNLPTRVGGRYPLHATGLGKVLLAFAPQEVLGEYLALPLKAFTPQTVTLRSRLLEELGQIRRRSFALDNQEAMEGLVCAAAPVRNHVGQVVASISASAPQLQYRSRVSQLVNAVVRTAALVEHRLSGPEVGAFPATSKVAG